MSETILHQRKAQVPRDREHGDTSEPDLETVQIVPVNADSEAEDDVVEQREYGGSCDAVVREHVCHHHNLVVHRRAGP